MKKLLFAAALSASLLCGCWKESKESADCDRWWKWEYQATLPIGTTTEQMLAAEATLRSNGYERVVFRYATSGWSDTPVGMNVYATRRKKGGAK